MDWQKYIRNIPNFPIEGIIFRDLTTLLKEGIVFKSAIDDMFKLIKDMEIDKIVAPDQEVSYLVLL